MGEGGVEAAALLHLRPVLAVEREQGGAHLLKGLAETAQLVATGDFHREAEVVFRDLGRGGVQYLDGPLELAPVEDDGAEDDRAEVGDGYRQDLDGAGRVVEGRVPGAVLRHDEEAALVACEAALAVGDAAPAYFHALRVVDDVPLGVLRIAVFDVAAVGDEDFLGHGAVPII